MHRLSLLSALTLLVTCSCSNDSNSSGSSGAPTGSGTSSSSTSASASGTGGANGLGSGGVGASTSVGTAQGGAGQVGSALGGSTGQGGNTTEAAIALHGAPLVFRPTADSFSINAVLSNGDPATLTAQVRKRGTVTYTPLEAPTTPADTIAQWTATGLEPGTHYQYQILMPTNPATQDTTDPATQNDPAAQDDSNVLFEGQALTQRPPGEDFNFTLITDSHVPQPDPNAQQRAEIEATYKSVMGDVRDLESPDFLVNLGDMLDFHLYGFNAPPARPEGSRDAYMNYRTLMGPLLGQVAHFPVIGNWEGENGCDGQDVINRSLSQRLLYMPGPAPTTYPEGGSENEDYYAFQWGDALFIVLNVMTYTTTCHLLSSSGGTPEDWTLGDEQLAWFEQTLENATSKWRFVMIHHVVGGAAGSVADANYGRGGGQSAYIGEQALIHQMMMQAGVQIFFYGHDHVFTDMVVDGIHYTLPGSAGAPWKFGTENTGYINYWPDSGYGRVHVSPEQVQVDFIAQGGAELYSYKIPDANHVSLNAPPLPPGADAGASVDAGLDAGATVVEETPDASVLDASQ